jgi:hypothetical protein
MELNGVEVPGSQGVSMYRVAVQEGGAEAGPILELKDTPQVSGREHVALDRLP